LEAQSALNKSIKEEGKAFRGTPAQPYQRQLRTEALLRNLDKMRMQILELEAKLKALEEQD
jgi:UDP-3-O-[3-hydroxymyristoyl] glucosamine N-acyltransferase